MAAVSGIRCMLMRGGTSKGAYFLAEDLPADPDERDDLLLRVMGSPDPRQIDGLGGAHPLTSKVAVVSPSAEPGIDVDYLFLQVGVDDGIRQPTRRTAATCSPVSARSPSNADWFPPARPDVRTDPARQHRRDRRRDLPHPRRRGRLRRRPSISGVPGTAADHPGDRRRRGPAAAHRARPDDVDGHRGDAHRQWDADRAAARGRTRRHRRREPRSPGGRHRARRRRRAHPAAGGTV